MAHLILRTIFDNVADVVLIFSTPHQIYPT